MGFSKSSSLFIYIYFIRIINFWHSVLYRKLFTITYWLFFFSIFAVLNYLQYPLRYIVLYLITSFNIIYILVNLLLLLFMQLDFIFYIKKKIFFLDKIILFNFYMIIWKVKKSFFPFVRIIIKKNKYFEIIIIISTTSTDYFNLCYKQRSS